ncbi:hypothetical protein SPHS6_00441 [Sphingobium sp. S6]|nr:hypothetical protein SPHS6_00441 [Sphingobium sp. S6]
MSEPIFKAEQPVLCDCGHTYKVSVIGLTEETELTCPACNESYCLDWKFVEKIEEDFIEMVDGAFTRAGIDVPDYAIIKFMRINNRLPDEADINTLNNNGAFK